jgi:hypothetical protein
VLDSCYLEGWTVYEKWCAGQSRRQESKSASRLEAPVGGKEIHAGETTPGPAASAPRRGDDGE